MMGEDDVEDMSEGSFNTKPVWARISVIAAGPIFNFILAFIFAVILVAWVGYDKPVISGVTPGYSAEAEGMQAGDQILKMNGKKINVDKFVIAPLKDLQLRNGKVYIMAARWGKT